MTGRLEGKQGGTFEAIATDLGGKGKDKFSFSTSHGYSVSGVTKTSTMRIKGDCPEPPPPCSFVSLSATGTLLGVNSWNGPILCDPPSSRPDCGLDLPLTASGFWPFSIAVSGVQGQIPTGSMRMDLINNIGSVNADPLTFQSTSLTSLQVDPNSQTTTVTGTATITHPDPRLAPNTMICTFVFTLNTGNPGGPVATFNLERVSGGSGPVGSMSFPEAPVLTSSTLNIAPPCKVGSKPTL